MDFLAVNGYCEFCDHGPNSTKVAFIITDGEGRYSICKSCLQKALASIEAAEKEAGSGD